MNQLLKLLTTFLLVCSVSEKMFAKTGVVFNINPLSRFIGSFGGDANCPTNPTHVPVILIHGNSDSSIGWTKETGQQDSFIDQLKSAGYTNCDIYAVSYLSISEQLQPAKNYHELSKMKFLQDYIQTVLKITGQPKVDIVAHSLGVTLTLETLHRFKMFGSVRKFVSIAGALHGIESCIKSRYITSSVSTCAGIINKKTFEFGFWPDGLLNIANPRMGDTVKGFANFPSITMGTSFYAISAGLSDEVICSGEQSNQLAKCQYSSYFSECKESNCSVPSQVLIGSSPNILAAAAAQSLGGDIAEGIGHMRAKGLSGSIVSEMLLTDCKSIQCCATYKNKCVAKPEKK